MRVYSCAAVGCLILASVIVQNPIWGIDRGWEARRTCLQYLKDKVLCRTLAEKTFARTFPDHKYQWPVCGKDDMAEALLWVSVSDRDFVDRYMEQFRRLCR